MYNVAQRGFKGVASLFADRKRCCAIKARELTPSTFPLHIVAYLNEEKKVKLEQQLVVAVIILPEEQNQNLHPKRFLVHKDDILMMAIQNFVCKWKM